MELVRTTVRPSAIVPATGGIPDAWLMNSCKAALHVACSVFGRVHVSMAPPQQLGSACVQVRRQAVGMSFGLAGRGRESEEHRLVRASTSMSVSRDVTVLDDGCTSTARP
jgi:hypothetical protein